MNLCESKKFSLVVQPHSCWHSRLDSCIEQLLRSGAEELKLGPGAGTAIYTLPQYIFCSTFLTELCLESPSGFDLKHCSSVNLPNLVVLTLKRNTLEEEMFNNFISGCPNLEILKITVLSGISSIYVSGLARLHTVELWGIDYDTFTRVRIVAPRLKIFKLLVEKKSATDIDLLTCESALKVLWLRGVKVTEESLRSHISRFPELEELVLQLLDLKSIEIPNKKIRKLSVGSCYELEKVEINASKLEVLAYYDTKLPFYPLGSDSSLKNFDAWCSLRNKFPSWVDSFKELFLSLSRFKDIKLILDYGMNVIVCEDLDESFIKMVCDMKETLPILEVMCIRTHEYMLNEIFSKHFGRIVFISLISRDHESHKILPGISYRVS